MSAFSFSPTTILYKEVNTMYYVIIVYKDKEPLVLLSSSKEETLNRVNRLIHEKSLTGIKPYSQYLYKRYYRQTLNEDNKDAKSGTMSDYVAWGQIDNKEFVSDFLNRLLKCETKTQLKGEFNGLLQ